MNLEKILQHGWQGHIAAFLSGAVLTLAFAPFGVFPLAIFCPALLLALWINLTPKQAAWRGWVFGLGFFGTGAHWVYTSMHSFGGMNVVVAGFFTLVFIAILSLFFALNGYWFNKLFPENVPVKIYFAFPVLWVAMEWFRSWFFTGFPWLFLGTSQVYSPLKGFAPILSVYGVSLIVLYSAALLYGMAEEFSKKHFKKMYSLLFSLLIIWAIGSALSFIHWTKPFGPPIKVSLIQGNIPQSLKWTREEVTPTLNRYLQLTNAHWDSKLIVWPEGAIPITLQDAQGFVNALDAQAKKNQTAIITGIPMSVPFSDNYYNTVIMVGNGTGIYAKRRLVPFGEYVPFQSIFGKIFDLLKVPMSQFISGPYIAQPLTLGQLKIATFICYEIAYPAQVVRNSADINLIVTVSDDAWFGHSVAQAQHLQIAQMRAIELGRPILFVSNNGLTAIINADGKIEAKAPPYQPYVLTDNVQPMAGHTLLQITSLFPIYMVLIFLFVFARRYRFPRK